MRTQTKELIKDRIKDLFGRISTSRTDVGSFYYDSYYKGIFEIINELGGVHQVFRTGTPKQTLDLLNNIKMYNLYIKNRT